MRAVARLGGMRARAESLMLDTCRITRSGGDPVYNATTGKYDTPPPITVYEGPCRLKSPALVNPYQADAAGSAWQVEESVLSLPVDGDGYAAGESLASGQTVNYLTAAYDQTLPGRVFGIVGPHHESQATARRLLVKEVTGTGA